MKQRLVQKQVQKLVMTQDLRQSIELLQYSSLELKDRIEQEMIENPMLELAEAETTPPAESSPGTERNDADVRDVAADVSHYDDVSDYGGPPDYEASDRKQQAIENTAAAVPGLAAHLLEQIQLSDLNDAELSAAEVIVSALDGRGFLTEDAETLLRESGFDAALAPKVLSTLAALDPPGCGARSIQEALLLQARLLLPRSRDAVLLLESHLDLLETGDVERIASASGMSVERVKAAIEIIRTLEPYPGHLYSSASVNYIIPDVVVMEVDGALRVFPNDSWIPDLRINEDYAKILESETFQAMKAEDREYLRSRYNSASWLIRGLRQRRQTLLRAMQSIVGFQEDFFARGPGNLRPLNLRMVAEDLGLHESTVSRITSNKYVQTRWGVLELKYFFARGLKRLDGTESESSASIQDRIRLLIAQETEPLSDQAIADILKRQGIRIARRTVAKYRGLLHLPAAELRRTSNPGA